MRKELRSIPDDELLLRLSALLLQSRRVESELVAHIGEVDARRLYTRRACSSMFSYCTQILHLSEPEAYLRIEVARAARKEPVLLEMLGDGRLHLSGALKLARHLTKENRADLLRRAVHASKREIEELVAELAPQTDAPAVIRTLPEPKQAQGSRPTLELGPGRVAAQTQLVPERVESAFIKPRPDVMKPLSPGRIEVKFTASAELRDKLERLQALIGSAGPRPDLAQVIDAAVTEKLERLEARRLGKTKAPRKGLAETDTSRRSRHIPAAVKRAVCERDGNRCGFVDEGGRRCTERHRLEFHHVKLWGCDGDHSPDSIALRCKPHNLHQAELDYGREKMERYRRSRWKDGVSEPTAVYSCGQPERRPELGTTVG